MPLRPGAAILLSLALLSCNDGAGPMPPPPPPPPPSPTISLVTTAPGPTGLAIHDGVLYWVDGSDTPFNKLPLSGGTPVGLFHKLPRPEAEISDGSFVYWVGGIGLYRTTLDGRTTILLDQGTDLAQPVLTMDATSIYWASSIPGSGCSPHCQFTIRRVPKAGGAGTAIMTTEDGVLSLDAIALAGEDVFWVEDHAGSVDTAGTFGFRIRKVPRTGGTGTTIVNGRLNGLIPPPGPGFIPASWHPRGGIVADTDFIYFGDADFFQSYRVMAVPTSGGAITILLADTTHNASDFVRSITSDSMTLYWIDENDVRSIPKSGGPVTDLAAARPHKPGSLTRAGTSLYWTENHCCLTHGKSSIYSIPTTGGTPAVVHDSVVTPGRITSDATRLYWIEGGVYGMLEGYSGLRSSALDGTNVTTVVEWAEAGPFASDPNALYFANRATIKRVSTAGGTPQRLAIGFGDVTDVTTDGERVYWVEDPGAVRSVPVLGGPYTTLGAAPGPAGRIRVGDGYVYWLAHDDQIYRVPKTGGTAVRIIGPISGGITDFDVDATQIYISEWDNDVISRAPLAGGTPISFTSPGGPDQTRRIAVHNGKVYWTDQLHVASITVDGQTAVSIHGGFLSDPFSVNGLAFDSQSVYWTENLMDAIRKATPK